MTRDHLEDLFLFLAASYPRWQVNAATLDAYEVGLCDLEAAEVVNAARHHQRTSPWPPTVAELRTLAGKYAGGSDLPTADAAWQEFHKAWKARDQFAPPPSRESWSTPLIAVAAERIPSWHALGGMSSEDFRWIGRDFRQAYTEALERRRFDATADAVKDLPLPEGIAALLEG